MKKSIIYILLILMLFITGCNKKVNYTEKTKSIEIIIVDNSQKEIFNQKIETNKKMLIDLLNELDIKLKYEDDTYGAYITSLMGYEQQKTDVGLYYWAYYIDDNYAESGISNCEIENNKKYKFVYEFYEN